MYAKEERIKKRIIEAHLSLGRSPEQIEEILPDDRCSWETTWDAIVVMSDGTKRIIRHNSLDDKDLEGIKTNLRTRVDN